MYCLNDKQIDFILDDIRARGVELEDLQLNLLDHVCCIIEQNLEENGDFENFYQSSIRTFYKTDLWEIEEETISLIIFKHFYTMKKIMLYCGSFSAFLVTFGIIFKFLHWPGAGFMLVLGLGSSSLIFLPLLLMLKVKEKQSNRDKVIVGLGSVAGIALSLGVLFKIQHWPGANMLSLTALLIMALVFLPVYFFTGIRNAETRTNTVVSSILIVIACSLVLALVRSPKGSYNMKLRDTADFVRSQELLERERSLALKSGFDSLQRMDLSLSLRIDSLCEELKSYVLMMECGVAKLDRQFESKEQFIEEGSYGYGPFIDDPKESINYSSLKSSVAEYNTRVSSSKSGQMPVPNEGNFIEYLSGPQPRIHSKLGLLNELTQIQTIVLQNLR